MSKTKVEDLEFTGGYNLLMLKAEEGNADEVHRILTELKNVDLDSRNKKGYSALALAVKAGNLEVVHLLISAGADVNALNNSGQNPLFLACWHNYEGIIKLLLDNGAEINSTDHRGWTPLMISAYHGHQQVVRELLIRNADVSIQDFFGKKAIDRAKDANIIKMLNGSVNLLTSPSPRKQQEKKFTPYSPPVASSEQKTQKTNNPLSILKKSNSKVSIGHSKTEMNHNNSVMSPQSTNLSIQKSPSLNSSQRRLTEPRRNSNQFKSNPIKKENQSAEKTPVLKNALNEVISPIKTVNTAVKVASSPSSTFERQLFKDDMEKLVVDQMGTMAHKIQQIVERKVALEIPMQMQSYENQFKKQVETILKFKAADIFKNLQAVFNLKLKFCLTRLGYDTTNLGLAAFFESETNYVPETISFSKEPLKMYNDKEFKAIEQDIERLEKSILNQKTPSSTIRGYTQENASPYGHVCDHTSQVHRTEMKNDLLDQLGMEVRSTTEYLLEYSSSKVSEFARDESGVLYKKIMNEVTENMEYLEDELKNKFDEIITMKLNRIVEVLGSAAGNDISIDKVKSPERQVQSGKNNGFKGLENNKWKASKYQSESEQGNPRDDRSATDQDPFRESAYSETKMSEVRGKSLDMSQTKERIQRIKNSLNFMDDEEYEEKPERPVQEVIVNENRRQPEEKLVSEFEEEEAQAPVPEPDEFDRSYDPTYRSGLTEGHYQPSGREYRSPVGLKTTPQNGRSGKGSQPVQSRGTYESKSNNNGNGKKTQIPGHRIAFNEKKSEEEMIKYYNFASE